MASLKYHLLREVADIAFRDSSIWSEGTPIVTSFALSGRVPSLIVRRMVQNEVITVYPYEHELVVKYGEHEVFSEVLSVLMAKWVLKLRIFCYDRFFYRNFSLFFGNWENEDLEELSVDNADIDNWPNIFKTFPKLVSLHLAAFQFDDMLRDAPNELAGLEEIGITLNNGFEKKSLADTCLALCEHQSKLPSLEVVQLKGVEFQLHYNDYPIPSKVTPMPSVKHLKIAVMQYSFVDINLFITVMQKVFPSLETFELDVEAYDHYGLDFSNIKDFYKAFHSLCVGFDLKVNYREKPYYYDSIIDYYRDRLFPKSTVTKTDGKFTAKTCFPGITIIHEVINKNYAY
uniref:FBD domain-containing protein n=1 Tax=Panagrellus redivivus TaxID=6233 RepID=A0A7E4WAP2_PANRE